MNFFFLLFIVFIITIKEENKRFLNHVHHTFFPDINISFFVTRKYLERIEIYDKCRIKKLVPMEFNKNALSIFRIENKTTKETLYFYNLQLFVINSELMALSY